MDNNKSYVESAHQFLETFYNKNEETSILFSYRFIVKLAAEAKKISNSVDLQGMDHQNAVTATLFRYAGFTDIGTGRTESMRALIQQYFEEFDYPVNDRLVVETAIQKAIDYKFAVTMVEEVVSDAVFSQLADPTFLENIILIKEELFRIGGLERPELYYLKYFLSLFVKVRYYTAYANENYTKIGQKNFELVDKRIKKIDSGHNKAKNETPLLTNKETEDLFKIAFRNYNHLISVADSKASLLMRVNSVIISITIAFLIGKGGRTLAVLWPAIILMTVSMITIFFAILASRPQNSSFLENKKSRSYQQFYFGSFDMVDTSFLKASWEDYFKQLMELFSMPKETVYMEVYKESYNVRRVLAKKFNYLTLAYWVFLLGFLISIIAFIISIYGKK